MQEEVRPPGSRKLDLGPIRGSIGDLYRDPCLFDGTIPAPICFPSTHLRRNPSHERLPPSFSADLDGNLNRPDEPPGARHRGGFSAGPLRAAAHAILTAVRNFAELLQQIRARSTSRRLTSDHRPRSTLQLSFDVAPRRR